MKTVRQVLARMISTKNRHTSTYLHESKPQGYQLQSSQIQVMAVVQSVLPCV